MTADAPMTDERRAELRTMLVQMRAASSVFYATAARIQCHPFIEITGFLNEYIQVAQAALEAGIDFADANTHSGKALPMQDYNAEYLAEKFDCMFGPSLRSDPQVLRAFWAKLGVKGKP